MRQKVTVDSIAKELSISVATVSRAINKETRRLVKKETLKLVEEVVKKYNYVPNRAAKMLSSRKTYTIGLLVQFDVNVFLEGYLVDIIVV